MQGPLTAHACNPEREDEEMSRTASRRQGREQQRWSDASVSDDALLAARVLGTGPSRARARLFEQAASSDAAARTVMQPGSVAQ